MTAIYLDHAATSPVHPLVLEQMLPYFADRYGNPSSLHQHGRTTRIAIDSAREQVSRCLGGSKGQIIFTSGGTESDNMALFGIAAASNASKRHIITSQIEHHAVLHSCRQLERLGCSVTYLPVDSHGRIRTEDVEAALRPETILISIMYVNNEVGTIQPIEQIGELARRENILFHTDAVQALGKIVIDLNKLPVDMLSFSAHKFSGPKGIGGLYVSQKAGMLPLIHGGSQEYNTRAGTENVAGIIGLAHAIELATVNMESQVQHVTRLRRALLNTLDRELGSNEYMINGHPQEGLPHIVNISFPGITSETMLMNLDLAGISASSGSACSSGSLEISHVLHAMHLPEEVAVSAVRFSLGNENTMDEVQEAARQTARIVRRIRTRFNK